MPNQILTEIRGNAMIVTFNCPERGNSLAIDMADQLFNVLKQVTVDRGIRAVMLRGEGGNFMNGLDLSIYGGDFSAGVERNNQLILHYHSAIRELRAMDKPVLAVVEGTIAGPGLSFMLASDLVLAARSAQFKGGFASYGMTPHGGASFFLTCKVGAAKAAEILMLNEIFDATEAQRLHLVNAVVDDANLHEEALQWIERLASGPTRTYAGVKHLVEKAFEHDLNGQLSLENTYWGASSRSFDFRDGVKARLTGREAKFTGA
jgi:2-(1,2-epoxy-1,2-dihydrophenyl)acetyl-CoA isomerase